MFNAVRRRIEAIARGPSSPNSQVVSPTQGTDPSLRIERHEQFYSQKKALLAFSSATLVIGVATVEEVSTAGLKLNITGTMLAWLFWPASAYYCAGVL